MEYFPVGNSGFLNEEVSIFADDFRLNLGVPAGILGNTARLDILIGGIGDIKSCSLSWKPPPMQIFVTTLHYAFE
jgi:hypothetical protein